MNSRYHQTSPFRVKGALLLSGSSAPSERASLSVMASSSDIYNVAEDIECNLLTINEGDESNTSASERTPALPQEHILIACDWPQVTGSPIDASFCYSSFVRDIERKEFFDGTVVASHSCRGCEMCRKNAQVIDSLHHNQEVTLWRLGPIERRVRRVHPHLWQIFDIHHGERRAWHVAYELDSYTTGRRAQTQESAFLADRFNIVNGPRAHGYQSHENRKIEKRVFWNKAKKYRRAQLVAIAGGKQ